VQLSHDQSWLLSHLCRRHVADTCQCRQILAELRVVATQKRDRNAQFISITAGKNKSAQTYRWYLSYDTFFVFELKGVADIVVLDTLLTRHFLVSAT